MHILIDSDVLLDAALGRTPHAKDAMALLDELETGPHTGFVAWHTIANLYYLARREPRRCRNQARSPEDESWYNGPPYAVAESVIDEYDVPACEPVPAE